MTESNTGRRVAFGILKLILVTALVLLTIYWGRKAYDFGYSVFAQTALSAPPGKDVAVTLDEGMTVKGLAELLEKKGLVKDAAVFYVQALLSEEKDDLKKGSYLLNTAQTPEEMLKILSGKQETETQ